MATRLTRAETAALIDAAEEVLAGEVADAFGLDDEDGDRLAAAMRSAADKLKDRLPTSYRWPWGSS